MKTSLELLEYQKQHTFEDVVLKYCTLVAKEKVLSKYGDEVYKALWVFSDGSALLLVDDNFEENI